MSPASAGMGPVQESAPTAEADARSIAAQALADGNDELLESQCRLLVQLNPQDVWAWFSLGVCAQRREEHAEAVAAYSQVLHGHPDCYAARLNRGAACAAQNDLRAARQEYETAAATYCRLHQTASWPSATWNLALLWEEEKQWHLAEKAYVQLISDQPDDAEAWYRLGFVRLQQDDYWGAALAWEGCLGRRRDWLEVAVNLGSAYFGAEDFAAAEETWASVLAEQPACVEALWGQAAVALRQQNTALVQQVRERLAGLGERGAALAAQLGCALGG